MSQREHPRPDLLLSFLRGEASPAERRAIVRHLLAGCRECVAVTQPAWELAEHGIESLPGPKQKGRAQTADMEAIK
jgi:hypothetical protein